LRILSIFYEEIFGIDLINEFFLLNYLLFAVLKELFFIGYRLCLSIEEVLMALMVP